MKGKKSFTNYEADLIRDLLRLKGSCSPSGKKSIRAKMRNLDFYISDFTSSQDEFDLKSFEKLVALGTIKISDGYSNKLATLKEVESVNIPGTNYLRQQESNDESYILDICDKVLGMKSSRQHTFDFLLGDSSINGKARRLPVDAYYKSLALVVEYRERQHTEGVKHFDKPDIMTISGVHRGEQRKLYDERRRTILPKAGINLVEFSYSDFKHNQQKRIIRDLISDSAIIKNKLKIFIK